ncbi:arsenate reductase (thioredoxin) [Enterococcus lactis]|uniref:arsenate reductase/protein-tyrosine-phosphatase family protein n=1 Tax=Enterococcus lactis TaxID=357441 RepID=UPI001C7DA093|nr:arsenate reductase (thioredoxin) [Enterococcus lactis]MBX4218996.1 arsenate reductase (thioredoxin) [Enterococcus lactis]
MKRIDLLVTVNTCRSQMAGCYAHKYLYTLGVWIGGAEIYIHGWITRALIFKQKAGFDISKQTSDLIDRDYFAQADLIITLCGDAKDKCPAVPNNHEHLHWDLKDPAQAVGSEEEILAEFRKVREVIKTKVSDLNQYAPSL